MSSLFYRKPWSEANTDGDYGYIKTIVDANSRGALSNDFVKDVCARCKSGNISKYGFDFYYQLQLKFNVFLKYKLKHVKSGTKLLDQDLIKTSYLFNYQCSLLKM